MLSLRSEGVRLVLGLLGLWIFAVDRRLSSQVEDEHLVGL